MGVKIIKPALGIQTITPGHAATLSIDTGPRYFDVLSKISATGQVLNEIVDKFVVKLGTKQEWEVTPDELDHLYKLMGSNGSTEHTIQNNTAGAEIHVPFWLMEPWRKGFVAQNALVWPTGDIEDGKFILEYHLKSTAHASVDIKTEVQFDNPVDSGGRPLAMGAVTKSYFLSSNTKNSTKSNGVSFGLQNCCLCEQRNKFTSFGRGRISCSC